VFIFSRLIINFTKIIRESKQIISVLYIHIHTFNYLILVENMYIVIIHECDIKYERYITQ